MADLEDRLSVLTSSFGDPPSTAELERRVLRRQRRRWRARRVAGAAAAVALVVGGLALAGADHKTTVRTASPSLGDSAVASPTTTALAFNTPVLLDRVDAGGQQWALYGRRMPPDTNCLELWSGPTIEPGWCWNGPIDRAQAIVHDYESFRMMFAIVPIGARTATIGDRSLNLLGTNKGFGASFVAFVLPAREDGSNVVVDVDGALFKPEVIPLHARVDAVNGQPVTSPSTAPPVTVTAPPRPPSVPLTTVPATTTIPPPIGGQAKRVTVTPGATSLQRHPFESAVASGAQSVLATFWDGIEPCSVLGRVDVVEAADKVTITLWTGTGPGAANQACIAIAQQKETLVALAAPLGARAIVDGAA